MSRSTSPTEYSADESGYVRSRVKRTPEPSEEYDPSEDSDGRLTDLLPNPLLLELSLPHNQPVG